MDQTNESRPAQPNPDAIIRALMTAEEQKTRAAYELHPDSDVEADDWSNAEPFQLWLDIPSPQG